MICLDDGKNDRKNTGLNVPHGDVKWDSNIVNTFTFSNSGGAGVGGPRMILVKGSREEKVAVPEEGSKEN